MWILSYQSLVDAQILGTVNCCLKQGETYTIGRSSKNQFTVKNDKSISRQHISIKWDNNGDNLVTVTNQGKVTMIRQKYTNVGESVTFNATEKDISFKIGTTPIDVSIKWKPLKINYLIDNDEDTINMFNNYGIRQVDLGENNKLDLVLHNGTDVLSQKFLKLYSIVYGIPYMEISELKNSLENRKNVSQFNSDWSKLLEEFNIRQVGEKTKIENVNMFQDIHFLLYTSSLNYVDFLEKSIKILDGSIDIFASEYLLISFISELGPCKYIIIDGPDYKDTSFKSTHKLVSIETIIDSCFEENINEHLSIKKDEPVQIVKKASKIIEDSNRISIVNTGITKDQLDNGMLPIQSSIKRRRLNRAPVQPLNSLNFFAGGVNEKAENNTDLRLNENELQNNEESLHNIEGIVIPPQSLDTGSNYSINSKLVIPQKRTRSPTQLENNKIKKSKLPSDREIENLLKDDLAYNSTQVSHKSKTLNNFTAESKENDVSSIPLSRSKTLQEFNNTDNDNDSVKDSGNLVKTIQEAKNREIKRVASTIVQVDKSELTEEAINEFKNLAIVKPNSSLICISKIDNNITVLEAHKNELDWNGRKNFKTFIKIVPKYKRQNQNNNGKSDSNSDFIKNSAFLLTRNYVPLKQYDRFENNKLTNDDLYEFPSKPRPEQNIELNSNNSASREKVNSNSINPEKLKTRLREEEVDDHSFTFSRSVSSNQLFVQDQDDHDEFDGFTQDKEIETVINSDDNQTKAVSSKIGAFNTSKVSSSSERNKTSAADSKNFNSNSHFSTPKTFQDTNYNIEKDEDDDTEDDDEPRFRFKRN